MPSITSWDVKSEPKPDIRTENLYRMMSYSFELFDLNEFRRLQTGEIRGLEQLLIEVLLYGSSLQRKRGFEHSYISVNEDLTTIRGRIDPVRTRRNRARGRLQVSCSYEDYSIDTLLNQILKAGLSKALRLPQISVNQRCRVMGLLPYFDEVSDIAPHSIQWHQVRYSQGTEHYKFLVNAAYMLIRELSPLGTDGKALTQDFKPISQSALYQNFVAAFIKRHFPEIKVEPQKRINAGFRETNPKPRVVPGLNADVLLTIGNKRLVIDTKFYEKILVENRGVSQLRPEHRNQIFTYAMNARVWNSHDGNPFQTAGMLLYAQTRKEAPADVNFSWTEFDLDFSCRSLDLTVPFEELTGALSLLVLEQFPEVKYVER